MPYYHHENILCHGLETSRSREGREEEKEEKKGPKKKQAPHQKVKSKPSKELRKKNRQERSLSPVSEEKRVSKRRWLRLAEETFSSSSSAEDEMSAITAKPMNATALAKSVQKPSRARERGIVMREHAPQEKQ